MLQMVQEKMQAEVAQRMAVVKELKEEKHLRWQADDALTALTRKHTATTAALSDARARMAALESEVTALGREREAAEGVVRDRDRAIRQLTAQVRDQWRHRP